VTEGLGTRHDDASESTGLLLWQVTNRWQAAQRAALKPYGLTHVQFVLLASLTWLGAEDDEPVTQRRLAGFAATDPMMTSQVVRALAERDWVTREPHPTDRRAIVLTVTVAGRALVNRAVRAVEGVDEAFFGPLGRQQTAFTEALRTLR
jgi:DNA-binding MarR family transcriptional regulator